MKTLKTISTALFSLLYLAACNSNEPDFDASGSFEAEETIISSEVSGIIKEFNIEEGQILKKGQAIGYIDSTKLYLQRKQLLAQIEAIKSRKPNISVQLASLNERLKTAETEKVRITNLVKANAATTKQLDDINAEIEVIKRQITAQKSSLNISSGSLDKEVEPLKAQIEQLSNDLDKCKIINPLNGTVLTKYAEQYEMTGTGKPLYKIADLTNIILRVYVSGNQLSQVKINQKVKIFTDDVDSGFKESLGTVSWINDKAEFTPKTI